MDREVLAAAHWQFQYFNCAKEKKNFICEVPSRNPRRKQ